MWNYAAVSQTVIAANETDEALRARLHYVAGGVREQTNARRIETTSGAELERVAEEYGLKRRRA